MILCNYATNSPVSQFVSSSSEQTQKLVLACKAEQPAVSCIATFHKYCCYKNMGVSYQIWLNQILRVWYWYNKMQQCGIWSMDGQILCTKAYDTFRGLFWSPAGSRPAARSARICEARLLV